MRKCNSQETLLLSPLTVTDTNRIRLTSSMDDLTDIQSNDRSATTATVDEFEEVFSSEESFQRSRNEHTMLGKTKEKGYTVARSAALFYVVSSAIFLARNVFAYDGRIEGREAFFTVFDVSYTVICLWYFVYNVREKEKLKSARNALLFGDAAVVAAANFVYAAAAMDIQEIDEVLVEHASGSSSKVQILLYLLPSIFIVLFQVGNEMFPSSIRGALAHEQMHENENKKKTQGLDKCVFSMTKTDVELNRIVPYWVMMSRNVANAHVKPFQLIGAIFVNVDILTRTAVLLSINFFDGDTRFWQRALSSVGNTRDWSLVGNYAFVLASMMVMVKTLCEIRCEKEMALYVDEGDSLEELCEFNND
ncbi:unnamed protein product [Bathycoccus prasinos]